MTKRQRRGGDRLSWMPLHVDDYLSATTTRLESAAEHGSYLLLILGYWKKGGPLANEDESLRRMAMATRDEWPARRLVLERFFDCTTDPSVWRHDRIEHELEHARRVVAKNSENGKAGNAARWGKEQAEMPNRSQTRSRTRSRSDRESIASTTNNKEKKTSPTQELFATSTDQPGVGDGAEAPAPLSKPPAKARPLTPQQANVQAILALFTEDPPPVPSQVAKWLSLVGFERVRELKFRLGARAGTGRNFAYFHAAVLRLHDELGDDTDPTTPMSDEEHLRLREFAAEGFVPPSSLEADA
jgi:uncharacterized protein YdaU (DUF1376 family)